MEYINTNAHLEMKLAMANLAAPQQAIPSVWQPIKTAPKDGTEIDVWCFDSENEGYRVANAWYCKALNKWRSYGDNELIWANMPSYWMPLPASPTAPIEEGWIFIDAYKKITEALATYDKISEVKP